MRFLKFELVGKQNPRGMGLAFIGLIDQPADIDAEAEIEKITHRRLEVHIFGIGTSGAVGLTSGLGKCNVPASPVHLSAEGINSPILAGHSGGVVEIDPLGDDGVE